MFNAKSRNLLIHQESSGKYFFFGANLVIGLISVGILLWLRFSANNPVNDKTSALDLSNNLSAANHLAQHNLFSFYNLIPLVFLGSSAFHYRSPGSNAYQFSAAFLVIPWATLAQLTAPYSFELNSNQAGIINFINTGGSYTKVTYTQDINGDNISEILIGTHYASFQGKTNAGSTYLIWGSPSLPNVVDLSAWNTTNIGIRFDGASAGDNSGFSISSVPDINGDNIPEILIGVIDEAPQGRIGAGSTYLIWGNRSLGNIYDLAAWNTSNAGIRFDGAAAGDNSGISATSVSDINGDNIPEILIGTDASPQGRAQAGSTYLIWGNPSLGNIFDLAAWNISNVGIRFDGATSGDHSGNAIASISDVNGDNIPELIIGANGAAPQGKTNAGSTYLIWGNSSLPNIVDLSAWNTSNIGIRFDGATAQDNSGTSVTPVPDVNGDLIPEILIGANQASPLGRINAGSTYLIWGNRTLANIVDLAAWNTSNAGIRFDGAAASDFSGYRVASSSDINGDNIPEILTGAYNAAPQGTFSAGSTYLIWGNSSLPNVVDLSAWNNSNIGIRYDGAVTGDYNGYSLTSVPDISGDGRPEILVGTHASKATLILSQLFGFTGTLNSLRASTAGIRPTTKISSNVSLISSMGTTLVSPIKTTTSSSTAITNNLSSITTSSSGGSILDSATSTTNSDINITGTNARSIITPYSTTPTNQTTLSLVSSSIITLNQNSKSSDYAIVGGVVGGIAVVALLAGLGIYKCRRKHNQPSSNVQSNNATAMQSQQGHVIDRTSEYASFAVSPDDAQQSPIHSVRQVPSSEYAAALAPQSKNAIYTSTPAISHYNSTVPPIPKDIYAENSEQWVPVSEISAEYDKAKAKPAIC